MTEQATAGNKRIIISVDAMGGDRGPAAVVAGLQDSASKNPDIGFIVHGDKPTLDRLIQPYVDNLKTMGVDAIYNRIDNAQFTKRRRDRDFDMMRAGYRNSLQPSTGLYQKFGSEAASWIFQIWMPL